MTKPPPKTKRQPNVLFEATVRRMLARSQPEVAVKKGKKHVANIKWSPGTAKSRSK
jgi:hypothetical protein